MSILAMDMDEEKKSGEPSTNIPSLTSKESLPKETDVETAYVSSSNPEVIDTIRQIHGFEWFLVCVALYLFCVLYGLDSTIAADIQGAVLEQFEEIGQLTWLGVGFPMASLCSILPAAALYNLFDLKIIFLASAFIFEVGSALCGAAPTMDALIIGRVIAGVGGSGIYIGLLNYFSLCTSHAERGVYISGMGLSWGVGAVLGPVVGGAFSTSSATWRWSFYINLVLAAICAPIYFLCLPSVHPIPSDSRPRILSRLAKIDFVGIILSTASIVTIVMALTFAGTTWAWNDHRIITLFVVFGVLSISTAIQQYFCFLTTPETRLLPTNKLLRAKTQILLYMETGCGLACLFIPLYYIPLYFQFVHADTSIMAAVRLLPFVVVLVTVNIAAGYLLPKISYYFILYLGAGIFLTIGTSLMYTVHIDTPAPHIYGFSVLVAIGSGICMATGYTISGIKVSLAGGSSTDVQSIMSLQNISTLSGTVLPLVISGQVFQSYALKGIKVALSGRGFTDEEMRSLIGGAGSVVFEKLNEAEKFGATDAITQAISKVYIMGIVTGGLALVCSLLMKRERLF